MADTEQIPDMGLIVQAVGTCQVAFVVVDVRDETMPIVFANEAFEALTGYRQAEILGRNCRFLQAGDRDQPARQVIRDALRRNASCRTVIHNYRKDGTAFLNEIRLSPIKAEDGTVTHFVGCQTELGLPNFQDIHDDAVARIGDLTAREREMFTRLVDGQSTKKAARSLGISPRTAEKHRQNLLRKLNAESAVELVHMAIRARNTELVPALL